jgi:hypothetical protein
MIITDQGLTEIFNMHDVLNLGAGAIGLKGIDLHNAEVLALANCSSLEQLDLTACELLTDQSVSELRKLSRLRSLDLSLCSMITDRSIISLARLPALRRISLNWCYSISDVALVGLAQCISLEAVSLLSCETVTDTGIEALSHLPHLKEIDLPEFALITDVGLTALAENASCLQRLKFNQLAEVSDAGIASLHLLKGLQSLTVAGCKGISEAGIAALQSELPTCEIVFSR